MTKKKSVLIVDDDKDILRVLKDFLSLSNYDFDIYSANNAENALNLLEGMRFDILITDHDMPGINGVEFTKIVKSLYPKTFVIGISGHPHYHGFTNAGAEVFLPKPIDLDELLTIVEKGISNHAG